MTNIMQIPNSYNYWKNLPSSNPIRQNLVPNSWDTSAPCSQNVHEQKENSVSQELRFNSNGQLKEKKTEDMMDIILWLTYFHHRLDKDMGLCTLDHTKVTILLYHSPCTTYMGKNLSAYKPCMASSIFPAIVNRKEKCTHKKKTHQTKHENG